MKEATIVAMAIGVVAIVILTAFAFSDIYSSPGKNLGPVGVAALQGNGSTVIIPADKTIIINSADSGAPAGPMVTSTSPIYHYVTYEIQARGYYILTGSWRSTVSSLFLVDGINTVFIDPPSPYETQGTVEKTLSPGDYYIEIGGWVGDRVTITSSIEAKSYFPYVVGSFNLPSGTTLTGPKTYSVYLNQSASLMGSFTVGGAFWFSISSSSGSASFGSYNTTSKPSLYVFNPFSQYSSPPVGPGLVNITFAQGTFYINQTLEFIYYVDNST
ncbi:MAG: hypothetical protein M1556_02605 [Candidatus Thermoplasmatota archaeon]|jgi:hypothetical protein|nr:hypothetical protein [Candidatus Thermoplasmatota archaeon]